MNKTVIALSVVIAILVGALGLSLVKSYSTILKAASSQPTQPPTQAPLLPPSVPPKSPLVGDWLYTDPISYIFDNADFSDPNGEPCSVNATAYIRMTLFANNTATIKIRTVNNDEAGFKYVLQELTADGDVSSIESLRPFSTGVSSYRTTYDTESSGTGDYLILNKPGGTTMRYGYSLTDDQAMLTLTPDNGNQPCTYKRLE